jgi:hypothetical protein
VQKKLYVTVTNTTSPIDSVEAVVTMRAGWKKYTSKEIKSALFVALVELDVRYMQALKTLENVRRSKNTRKRTR